ncbi:MAG: carbohydrate ABC transporter permease [Anaerolineae bacterium]|nr:carbohydrate ABC transporter permease [Anaerolineae bacterium]
MNSKKLTGHFLSISTIILALIFFFPIFWMFLTSFKTEADAFVFPPLLVFQPTLENYQIALVESGYFGQLWNTLIITGFSTLFALVLGVPAAYSLAFYPGKRSNFTLMWMMSTRMLPPVGIVVPLYVIFKQLSLFDTHGGMVLLFAAMNLPLVVWMMHSFLSDLPYEILEAARIDGVNLWQELRSVILPLALPGLVATCLLCFIFAWNEFFFAFNLTITKAAPLSVFIASFKTSEGLFWAKMSAAAVVTELPVVLAGWVAQHQLVRGLTAGAVK